MTADTGDVLKSIKVYKFNNTKENWHEFALKFRVIANSRGCCGIIDGSVSPPDKKETITVTTADTQDVLKAMKDKLKARAANKLGYRDHCYVHRRNIAKHCGERHIQRIDKKDLKKTWKRLEGGT